jgi:hypothetical protein
VYVSVYGCTVFLRRKKLSRRDYTLWIYEVLAITERETEEEE